MTERDDIVNSWTAYRHKVLDGLEAAVAEARELRRELADFKRESNDKLGEVRTEIALLKFKTGVIATLVSAGVSALGAFAYAMLHR